ncbi:MAG: dihydropteroate synthase [Clostridiales bacterium]|nr:dihydropteroate synthase [Clostridiales bacterium]
MKIGNREFDTENETYVMGILNVTPDSFSDGGRYDSVDRALRQTERMIREGADLIDIGGESTRPGYTMISDEEEIARTLPVIEAVKDRFDIPVSLDTYKSGVARAGLEAGADLINDIWGLKYDPEMADLIAAYGVPCCLMHNREQADDADPAAPGSADESDPALPGNAGDAVFVAAWKADLAGTIRLAKQAGICDDRIILDPGVGFGKTYENNLQAIRHLDQLHSFGYPLLLGASRKSVIGLTLDVPADDRVVGTAVTTVFAVIHHCAFVRVHDVRENVQAIRMARAILGD